MGSISKSVGPFIELMRVSNPTGSCLIFFPYFIGFVSAIDRQLPVAMLSWDLIRTTLIFGLAAFMLHSAGCSWNDLVDADIDRKVSRTKSRPVARGAVSISGAFRFTLFETGLWLTILSYISSKTVLWALPLIPAVTLYPYCKRLILMPSVFLGFLKAWGIFVGAYAVGQDPTTALPDHRLDTWQFLGLFCHFLAYVLWMSIIDMIYAFQDFQDDLKLGVYSMAVTFQKTPKLALGIMAVSQITLLGLAGRCLGQGIFYYVSALFGGSALNAWMISAIRLQFPEQCWWWFQSGSLIMQGLISVGVLGDLVLE